MAIDQSSKRKRGRPAGAGSPSVSKSERDQMVMEQKMALVQRRLALLDNESDKEADVVPTATMDNKLAIVVDQQPIVINCDNTDDEDEYVPLRIVRPRGVDSEQKRLPDVSQTHNAQDTDTDTAKKKRGRLVSAKSNMEQRLKVSTALVENSASNSSKSDMDDNHVPMVAAVNSQNTCASDQGNFGSAMERAQELLVKLPAEHPSFVKYMLHSHVVRGFWLGLPSDFCNKRLPKKDTTFVLEDEDGHNYDAKYLGAKQGLSGGWRGFAINHDIKVGDVVVFQLVSSEKFKVYILRANNFTTTDGALGLLHLEAGKEKMPKEESSNDAKPQENPKVQSDSSNTASESVIDGIRFSDTVIDFDDVKDFSNFSIIVDGLVVDCKFPDHQRKTYYELCCAQKSFLHKDLLKGICLNLSVGVIMETICIAEAVRASKAQAYSHKDFAVWRRTLEAFEMLGMNVELLLKRVDELLDLPAEREEYKEVKVERARAGNKMKELRSRMSSLRDDLKEVDAEVEELKSRSDEILQRLATAPW